MRILGIELGSWSVKAVEMESRFRRFEILDFHEIRLPLQIVDPVASYKSVVQQIVNRLPSHPEKIVTSIPAAQTALRFLNIPIKKRKKVEQMFRFELEDSVPFKLDDAIIEHHVSRTKEGSMVFAAIAPKRHVQSYIDWLSSIGLDPDWLTFEGMGLVNLYLASLQEKQEEKPTGAGLLLDMGHQKTNLAIIDEGQLSLFRSISWGGATINHAIAINLGIPVEDAEKEKINNLILPSDAQATRKTELMASAFQGLQPFLADINHSLVAFRNQTKREISSIQISGGTSKIKGITEYLANQFSVPVSQFNPFENVELKEDLQRRADPYRFAEPWGRALVFARKSPLLFNFRRENLTKQSSLTEVTSLLKNPSILKLAFFAFLAALVLFIHVNTASYLADQQLDNAHNELKKAFQETFRSVPPKVRAGLISDPNALKKYINQKDKELDQKLKMLSKTRTPMLGILRMVSQAFPASVRVDVNSLEVTDRTFTLEGVVYEGSLDPVTANIKKIPLVDGVTLHQDGQRFTYEGKVVGR